MKSFADGQTISSWAQASVAFAASEGIATGMQGNAFAPTEHATRAQATVMLKRYLEFVEFINKE